MQVEIIRNILSSISLVMLIAYLMTRLESVKRFIATDRPSPAAGALMAVIFGGIGIISTYTGISVQGAIANTRVIGVMAGGILGGPLVGVGAGLIAGLHRLSMDPGGFTSVACAVSTVLEGVIAGAFSSYLKRNRNNGALLFCTTFLAELVQMGTILAIARPVSQAWELVKVIFLPMTFLNALGVAFFVKVFDSVFDEQDRAAATQVRLVLEIADQCLPYLRQGLGNHSGLWAAVTLIRKRTGAAGVMITDCSAPLAYAGELLEPVSRAEGLPKAVCATLERRETRMAEDAPQGDPLWACCSTCVAVCAPLVRQDGAVIGTLTLLVPRYRKTLQAECGFAKGLAALFSTQLALSQIENQQKLLEKAEYAALQSQINPHFFFNALSTITAFCREKPERARELLIVLANYFRNTLNTSCERIPLRQELEHVNCYLELEKARFEEKLHIQINVPPALLEVEVPSLILQPLVENAVKHGAMRNGRETGWVHICAESLGDTACIWVKDNGPGIAPEILQQLDAGTLPSDSVGLTNVHRRLISLYGEGYGLRIRATPRGTRVTVRIPKQAAQERSEC